MAGKPPTHLVLQALAALARLTPDSNGEAWAPAETLRSGTGRTTASMARSLATAADHCWADRRYVGTKMVCYQITGAGRAELRRAGLG